MSRRNGRAPSNQNPARFQDFLTEQDENGDERTAERPDRPGCLLAREHDAVHSAPARPAHRRRLT
ncbi:MAG: hypothetical protein IT337_08310 [Thermomicrobiales bacterium]|nr:hypothetical protein [Thermomicrobiales bacterium]